MTVYSQISRNKLKSTLLIVGFVAFIAALGVILSYAFETGLPGMLMVFVIAVIMALVSYYAGDKIALLTNGAKGPITAEQNPYVYRLVENLAITAGLPMPKVYIINDTVPNAFATGRDPEHASIAFTTGIIELLENEELEGVAAHELSHIKNYDVRLMTIVIVCVGIVSLLANGFFRFSIFGHNNRDSKNQLAIPLMLLGLVLIILSPFISKLIQFAVSRKREFLADASGVLLTRYPEGLARALEKISSHSGRMKQVSTATAHLFIANPFGPGKHWNYLFSTHPPVEQRVQALRSIA